MRSGMHAGILRGVVVLAGNCQGSRIFRRFRLESLDMRRNYFKKPTTWMVIAFVVLFCWFLAGEARSETLVEVAPAAAYGGDVEKGQFAAMLHERFAGKYDVGVILLVDLEGDEGNRGIEALRTVKKGSWEAGIGWALWANQSAAWNAENTFALTLGYTWANNWGVRWRHWSTGGTSSRNAGLDMLTVGYSFE